MYDNKNGIFLLLLIIALIFSLFTVFVSSESFPALSAKSAVLYSPETEEFLYTENENQRLPMASTTKIMTALIALEELDTDEIITVDENAVGIEGSSVYLKPCEQLTALDLVYALILQSANDAAAALAYRISGGIPEFASLMNARAESLGLQDTNFKNPHGLDDKEHYTSAHDLSLIAAEALKNEKFKNISSTYKKEITSSECTRTLVNHNKLLKSYDGCIGVKTGYTKKSGRSLVSAAEKDGLMLIAVTINAPDDWRDHKNLLDYGYGLIEKRRIAFAGEYSFEIPVINGEKEAINVSNENEAYKILKKSVGNIEAQIKLPRFISAPVKQGDIIGKVIFKQGDEMIAELNLTANESVNKEKKTKFNLFDIFKNKE